MFLTCSTYRQAAYSPDQTWTGLVTNLGSTKTSYNVLAVGGTAPATTLWPQFSSTSSNISQAITRVIGVETGSVYTSGGVTMATLLTTGNGAVFPVPTTTVTTTTAGTTTSTTKTASTTQTSNQGGTTYSTSSSGVSQNLFGQTSFSISSSWSSGATTSFLVTSNTAISTVTSTASSSGNSGVTTSTSANGAVLGTSVQSTIVTTVAATFGGVSSTTTVSTTFSRYTAIGSVVTTTAATTTRVTTTGGTAAVTISTTSTITTATPSWWGWSSELGTVLLATGNGAADDLPAWLEKSNNTSAPAALWKYSAASQTTLWPSQPIGQVNSAASIASTAVVTTSGMTFGTSATTFTVIGTSAYTTTTSSTAVNTFAGSDPSVPLATISVSVTSFSSYSTTVSGALLHNCNTTTTNTAGGVTADRLTVVLTSTTQGSTLGILVTLVSTATVTSLIGGYTTASVAYGIGGNTFLQQTTIITGPQLSVVTTTITAPWFYDWSCPTVILNLGTTTSSSSSSPATLTIQTNFTSVSSISGFSQNFTQNVFAAPVLIYQQNSSLSFISNATQTVFAPAAVAWWAATPQMQGFAPITSPSSSYHAVVFPIGVGKLPLAAFQSGRYIGMDGLGNPVTSTAWGVWGIIGNPVSTTFTTTTGTGPAFTGTSVAYLSFTTTVSSTGTGGTTTASLSLKLPANGDQAAATVSEYQTVSYTTVVTGSTVSTTSTNSSTASGITISGAATSTYCESYAYTTSSILTATITAFNNITFNTGGTHTAASNVLTTTTVLTTSTFSLLVYPPDIGTAYRLAAQIIPGVGGIPKITTAADTIYANGAAISLFGSGSSTGSWSSADPNFFVVVAGGTFTASSSTTSNLGAGVFVCYTIPGQFSLITSPALWVVTSSNRWVTANTYAVPFWQLPNPLFVPASTP